MGVSAAELHEAILPLRAGLLGQQAGQGLGRARILELVQVLDHELDSSSVAASPSKYRSVCRASASRILQSAKPVCTITYSPGATPSRSSVEISLSMPPISMTARRPSMI